MFTRLVVLFIATSLHKSAGLEGITQFSFSEAPPQQSKENGKVEVNHEVNGELPEATAEVHSEAIPKVVEESQNAKVEVQPNVKEGWFKNKANTEGEANPKVVEESQNSNVEVQPGENGAGTPPEAANEKVQPIVPPVLKRMKGEDEIRGLANPFTSNPQLTDADQRLQDFSKQLKEASTQMSGLYDTLVAQMDLYKSVLGTMVHNSRTLMSNMKVMLHEEGTALEMKNQARMKPVLGLDALIKEHHEIFDTPELITENHEGLEKPVEVQKSE